MGVEWAQMRFVWGGPWPVILLTLRCVCLARTMRAIQFTAAPGRQHTRLQSSGRFGRRELNASFKRSGDFGEGHSRRAAGTRTGAWPATWAGTAPRSALTPSGALQNYCLLHNASHEISCASSLLVRPSAICTPKLHVTPPFAPGWAHLSRGRPMQTCAHRQQSGLDAEHRSRRTGHRTYLPSNTPSRPPRGPSRPNTPLCATAVLQR